MNGFSVNAVRHTEYEDISLPLHDSDEEKNVTQKPDRYEVVPTKPMVEMQNNAENNDIQLSPIFYEWIQ